MICPDTRKMKEAGTSVRSAESMKRKKGKAHGFVKKSDAATHAAKSRAPRAVDKSSVLVSCCPCSSRSSSLNLATRQWRKWSGLLKAPQRQRRSASTWLNLSWYAAKSPWPERAARSLASAALDRASSGGGRSRAQSCLSCLSGARPSRYAIKSCSVASRTQRLAPAAVIC